MQEIWNAADTEPSGLTAHVIRVSALIGELQLRQGETVLERLDVPLAYEARFGPDVDDVSKWLAIVDEWLMKHG